MSVQRFVRAAVLSALFLWPHAGSRAFAQACPGGACVTYQGQLKSSDVPANGVADFRFSLFDASSGGVMIGPLNKFEAVVLTNGLFMVSLDFGPTAFSGADRFLEVAARFPHDPTDALPFTILSPRQPIGATPMSLQTRGIHVAGDGKVGLGTNAPTEELTVAGDTALSVSGQYKGTTGALGFLSNIGLNQVGVSLQSTSNLDLILDTDNNESGFSAPTFRVMANGTNRQNADTLLIMNDRGNMNIGATNFDPDKRLEVGGVSHPFFSPGDPVTEIEIFHYHQDDVVPAGFNGAATSLRFDTLIDFPTAAARTRTEAFITTETNVDGSQLFRFVADSANTVMTFENTAGEAMRINSSRRVGIGTTAPEAQLHVHRGSAGSVTANGNSTAVLESNINGYLTLLVPDANECGILFGQPVDSAAGGIIYNNGSTADGLQFRTNGNATRMVITSTGLVGIGTLSPAATLDVDNGATVANFNRTGADGVLLNFQNDGAAAGSISVAGLVVSYNAFSGAHYAWSTAAPAAGALVSMTGENRRFAGRTDGEIVYGVKESTFANDPACLGAYLGSLERDRVVDAENPLLVTAVGNGDLCVVDGGSGDIRPGDYLISSDVPGCAMKDDPRRFPVGYVIARAAEAVTWSAVAPAEGNPVRRQIISVLFDSMVRGSDTAKLEREVTAQNAELQKLRAELEALRRELSTFGAAVR